MDKLDRMVVSHIEERLLDPERIEDVLASLLDRRQESVERRSQHIAELNQRAAEADMRLKRLYDAIEAGSLDPAESALGERIAGLTALRDQARADAETDLFLVSFVAYDVSSVVGALNAAAARGIEIRILLETSTSHGGSLSVDPVATMRSCVPSATLYVWTDRPAPFTEGRVHAKVAVADGISAFLTSANLTGHALEKNMEAGVVINGGHVPAGLRAHLHALVETRVIRKI